MIETLSSYIRMSIKMYPHKHGEELASEILELLRKKGFDIHEKKVNDLEDEIIAWANKWGYKGIATECIEELKGIMKRGIE